MKTTELISCLGELHAARSQLELADWALNDFAGRFGTDCTIWTQFDAQGSMVGAMLGRQTDPGIWNYGPVIQEHMQEHPVFHMLRRAGEAPVACKTTDAASQRELDETPLFRDAYRHMGCRYHLALVLEAPEVPRCTLAIGRNGSDYSAGQVQALQTSAQHLLLALTKLGRIDRLEKSVAGPGALRFRALKTGGRWYFTFTDDETAGRVAKNFGRAAEKFLVPPLISVRLDRLPVAGIELICSTGLAWKLRAEPDGPDQASVWIEPGPLVKLREGFPGLTTREAETAVWLCEGKSNPEIAIILGISAKTVEKHMEGVFRKVGVEGRVAAVQRLLGAVRSVFVFFSCGLGTLAA